MYRYIKFYILAVITLTSCSSNVLQDISSRDSSEALYEDAVKLMDQSSFGAAYDKLSTIEAQDVAFSSTDKFKKTKAGVQAGQCGMSFIPFITALTSASGGNAFKILMESFTDTTVVPQKCADAQATIESLSVSDDNQLLFMAVLGMAKVGVNLRDKADRDGASSLGDGSEDATFDICDSTSAVDKLTDADMKQVITGLGLTLQNFALIGGSFSGSSAESSLTDLQAFCDDPAGDGTGGLNDADQIDCQITDKDSAALTDPLLRAFRRTIKTYDQGIGATAPGCDLNPLGGSYCCPLLATP